MLVSQLASSLSQQGSYQYRVGLVFCYTALQISNIRNVSPRAMCILVLSSNSNCCDIYNNFRPITIVLLFVSGDTIWRHGNIDSGNCRLFGGWLIPGPMLDLLTIRAISNKHKWELNRNSTLLHFQMSSAKCGLIADHSIYQHTTD